MSYLSVGDMARAYQMRTHNAQLKTTMSTLTEEVTTGIKSDAGAAVGGDFRALASVNASLARLESYATISSETGLYLSTMQTSMDAIRGLTSDVATGLMAASEATGTTALPSSLNQAKSALDSVLSTLNTTVSGRYIFSGVETGKAAMASSDTLMAALGAATSGLTNAQDIADAVDQWFGAPAGGGGYLDTMFGGSTKPLSGLQVSDRVSVSIPVTAADSSLRDTIRGLALAALAAEGGAVTSDTERQKIASMAGERLLNSNTAIIATQADLGQIENRVDEAKTRNTAEKTALGLARLDMVGADEYETATALEATRAQLETLYTLTSKLSGLSLVNYL